MSSCNCMLSGSVIAANTGTNVCDDHAKLMTYMSLANSFAGCQNHLGSKPVNLEDLSSKTTSSKPAEFFLFVLFLLVLFRLCFFSGDSGLIPLNGIGQHSLNYIEQPSGSYNTKKRVNFMPWRYLRFGYSALIDVKLYFEQTNPFECFFTLLYFTLLYCN